ncbi:hypothetical protein FVB32_16140 [Flagellimonas hymeniacidonis]|uniref:Uncharacterized protein n=1 Tax=Flagellimonas hymeniacidonis TaxID=2603628 RepID=A0A5C8V5M8_9FLAO|nr:hypothetical protein [Flagellimonas hymeniacidonis]TXN36088.1 hypothetical protein FVB32_16140 [Flagellimonas hymeniacidonis]
MPHKYTPSVNILRDSDLQLNYVVTPNAERIASEIFSEYNRGFHSFTLIGSFGTGKSSFLWALEQTLLSKNSFFDLDLSKFNDSINIINFVGEYTSIIQSFNEKIGVQKDFPGNQILFDVIFQEYEKVKDENGLLIIAIDEFGKFLEYAAKNDPNKEMYFVQKLAEFVNSPDRNILLITTLHQSIESYGSSLESNQIQEWKKVKGRFKELTFNEPVEQLLHLATSHFKKNNVKGNFKRSIARLIGDFKLFTIQSEFLEEIENDLYPLDSISAYVLATSIQKYGQNERSLFTFLNSMDYAQIIESKSRYGLQNIYDYLFKEFYNFLTSKSNPDYSNWYAIKTSIERVEAIIEKDQAPILDLVKAIGLLSIFCSKGAKLNGAFFESYFFENSSNIPKYLEKLSSLKIIRFNRFNNSFKLFEGTDLDIEHALIKAENQIDDSIDILSKLKNYFEFPIITAKSVSYTTGTPRLFEFILTNKPIDTEANGEIDGFINLIFDNQSNKKDYIDYSKNGENAVLYGFFNNTNKIFETLFEIQKSEKVLKDMEDQKDRVAIRELLSIISSQKNLLNHYVMDSLYSDRITWFRNGHEITISNKRDFNKQLSKICSEVYNLTPRVNNELFNKHKISGAISAARKSFWKALVQSWDIEDIGFPKDKWPAEKTIYYTLLKQTGIHVIENSSYTLKKPQKKSEIIELWNACDNFMLSSREKRTDITELIDILSSKPYKLKQGVIDFWIPIFLFIRRGDFALFNIDTGFVPYIDETTLYMITRNPQEYSLKSFELDNLRLTLFNKYRAFLKQESAAIINNDSFIESIRPLLVFYRDLDEYSKITKNVSEEAIKLRQAIAKAKDPEVTFFEDFPNALGYSLKELSGDKKVFDEYIIEFQNKIEEIKSSYGHLKIRLESYINQEILGADSKFPQYKEKLKKRFSSLKEHQILNKHKVFLMRINSNINDRDSWLVSVCQSIMGKPLDSIKDSDEKVLKDRLSLMVKELDNLTDLNRIEQHDEETVLKLELTSIDGGLKEHLLRIPNSKQKIIADKIKNIKKELEDDENMKIPILAMLLKQELDSE